MRHGSERCCFVLFGLVSRVSVSSRSLFVAFVCVLRLCVFVVAFISIVCLFMVVATVYFPFDVDAKDVPKVM